MQKVIRITSVLTQLAHSWPAASAIGARKKANRVATGIKEGGRIRALSPCGRSFALFAIPLLALLLQGCDPTIYKKPLTDFRDANQSMRDAYFLQLAVNDKARVENSLIQAKGSFWMKANPTLKQIESYSAEVAKARQKKAVEDEQTIALRHLAFKTIGTYASILLSLASNDSTDAISAEVNGLVGDASKIIEHAKTIQKIHHLSEEAAAWLGPMSNMVTALVQVGEIVSGFVRNRAIRQTIMIADQPIHELIVILRSEAVLARQKAIESYAGSEQELRNKIESFEENNKRKDRLLTVPVSSFHEAAACLQQVDVTRQELEEAESIGSVFDAALKSQASLVRKAAMPSYEDWVKQIEDFRDRANAVKISLQAISAG
ncbi:MAG: hypothetical protein COW18_13965 [Zetaproteobacteria bacterium CG12_big_fil_rev_8_21_14_0_65_54_13]|nr:MAG: hypothetical protein COW18_13965 [Zetaproteobacteria bacterium CG12_big_fil_rev_8_21_14_0_65_54_13]